MAEPRTRTFLRELCAEREIGPDELARLARSSPYTAAAWLRPYDNASARNPPDAVVELVCIKLGVRPPFT